MLCVRFFFCKCKNCGQERKKQELILNDKSSLIDEMSQIITKELSNVNEDACINIGLCKSFLLKWLDIIKTRGINYGRPEIVYHWTRKKNFDSISQNGLLGK